MKIICVGLNYDRHIREFNFHRPDAPTIFLKPDSAILRANNPFFTPEWAERIDYEAEIVFRINRLGRYIDRKFAHRYYDAVAIGIDFTERNLQQQFIRDGRPWELSKAFDNSAAISEFIPIDQLGCDPMALDFHLDINGQTRQKGNTRDMLYPIDEIIEYASRYFTLKTGDLIYTGTPEGVGPVSIDDHLQAYIANRLMMDFRIK